MSASHCPARSINCGAGGNYGFGRELRIQEEIRLCFRRRFFLIVNIFICTPLTPTFSLLSFLPSGTPPPLAFPIDFSLCEFVQNANKKHRLAPQVCTISHLWILWSQARPSLANGKLLLARRIKMWFHWWKHSTNNSVGRISMIELVHIKSRICTLRFYMFTVLTFQHEIVQAKPK